MAEAQRPDRDEGWTPRPDPTLLTTEALHREIAHVKELHEVKLQGKLDLSAQRHELTRQLMDTRLDDHAKLSAERFDAIRRETDLAISAAERAVAKAEDSTTKTLDAIQSTIAKQFDALAAVVQARTEGLQEQIIALKERQDRNEGKGTGIQASWGVMAGVIAAMGTIITVVVILMNVTTGG